MKDERGFWPPAPGPRPLLPILLICVLAGFGPAGCMVPASTDRSAAWGGGTNDRRGPDTGSNVIRVNKFFSADPWLSFQGEGTGKVDGIRCTVYLEGAGKPKGIFGTGTILVHMYRLDPTPEGGEESTLMYEWNLPPPEAYPWRAKRETMMGWGYGLRLHWDKDLDVAGRQVVFVIRYLREDGRVVSSSRQVLKVPLHGSKRVRKQ